MRYRVEITRVETFELDAPSEDEAKDQAVEWSTFEEGMDTDFGDAQVTAHYHQTINMTAVEL